MPRQDYRPSPELPSTASNANDISSWGQVYDQYAPMMYGTIVKMTEDEKSACDILQDVFLDLTKKSVLPVVSTSLMLHLLRHTYQFTIKWLEIRGINPKSLQPTPLNYPHINLFFFQEINLKQAAQKNEIAEIDIQKKLRAEFNQLRTRSH
jgi:hypothetical protein